MEKQRTHVNAFKWETVVYSFGDIPIPIPKGLNISTISYFCVSILTFVIIGGVVVIGSPVIHYAVLPITMTVALKNINPEGKEPLKWLVGFLKYQFTEQKEEWNFEAPVKYADEGYFNDITMRRRDYEEEKHISDSTL